MEMLTLVPSASCTTPGWVSDASTVPSGGWVLVVISGSAASRSTRLSNVSNNMVEAGACPRFGSDLEALPPRPRLPDRLNFRLFGNSRTLVPPPIYCRYPLMLQRIGDTHSYPRSTNSERARRR